jgi:hypothetical protein
LQISDKSYRAHKAALIDDDTPMPDYAKFKASQFLSSKTIANGVAIVEKSLTF